MSMKHFEYDEIRAADAVETVAPYFDQSRTSHLFCVIGLTFSWVFGLGFLAAGIFYSLHDPFWKQERSPDVYISPLAAELVSLFLNILVTTCNESMGLINTISLRWALHQEGRLVFSSNLRLLTSSRRSNPNRWYINAWSLICMIAAYSSSSLCFLAYEDYETTPGRQGSQIERVSMIICGPGMIALGSSIIGQAIIATWSLCSMKNAPTWTSNPVDIAAACLTTVTSRITKPSREMESGHSVQASEHATLPSTRQGSMYRARKGVRKVLWFLWAMVILILIWGVVIYVESVGPCYSSVASTTSPITFNMTTHACSWSLLPNEYSYTLYLGYPVALQMSPSDFAWVFFFVSGVQALLTLLLHCAELIVNCSRDEVTWRKTSSKDGLLRNRSAVPAVLTSWQAISLFCLKSVLHWIYGLAMSPQSKYGLVFRAVDIFYLAVGVAVLATFGTGIVLWRPNGPQPATFGHLQTLVHLIDEWPNEGETMYWGHKSIVDGLGHAGTSSQPLPHLYMDVRYDLTNDSRQVLGPDRATWQNVPKEYTSACSQLAAVARSTIKSEMAHESVSR